MANGIIDNRKRAKQLFDFSDIHFGKLYPTDIDFHLDYYGKAEIFGEYKFRTKPLPKGQRIALENLVKHSTVPAIAFIAWHNVANPDDDIPGNQWIREFYYDGKWHDGKGQNVKGLLDKFTSYCDNK